MGPVSDDDAPPADDVTLEEARDWLRDRVDDGATCPLCSQFAKVYRRTVHSTMARVLILAYRQHDLEWFQLSAVERLIGRGGSSEAGKLRYWGLVEEEAERRPDGGRAGWWRVTPAGRDFVLERVAVPRHALVYDGRCLGLEGAPLTVRDALGTRFDLAALMRGEL